MNAHSNFFDAYIAALARAIDDHIITSSELIHKIYQQTIEEDTEFWATGLVEATRVSVSVNELCIASGHHLLEVCQEWSAE